METKQIMAAGKMEKKAMEAKLEKKVPLKKISNFDVLIIMQERGREKQKKGERESIDEM